jgi:hypothetical protein
MGAPLDSVAVAGADGSAVEGAGVGADRLRERARVRGVISTAAGDSLVRVPGGCVYVCVCTRAPRGGRLTIEEEDEEVVEVVDEVDEVDEKVEEEEEEEEEEGTRSSLCVMLGLFPVLAAVSVFVLPLLPAGLTLALPAPLVNTLGGSGVGVEPAAEDGGPVGETGVG